MEDRDRTLDWSKPVGIPDEHPKVKKNIIQGCFHREIGRYKNNVPSEFLSAAEDKLVHKNTYEELKCQLPDSPRSTFLMVFSPDGKKVASTHGNHNVYVTDLTTGKNIQTLSGHPRTPWCIAFHPSSNQILASGCLAGQVRVWDLHGGSEVWTAESQSVIASLAFHPVDRMLVIATYNELHFWDWSQSKPFAKCSTRSEKEKVRYVSFDRLGNKLITGIANPVNTPPQWDRVSVVNNQPMVTTTATTSSTATSTTVTTTSSSMGQGRSVTYCDSYLMNQYSQLVRRYIDLSRSRSARTIDRGTDPMDLVDVQNSGSQSETTRTGSTPSTSQANSNRSVRYRIMRSTCRSYRPPSSRERFRIHSSLLSGLPSRSPSSSNSLVRTTTTTTTTSQSIIFTTIATTPSSSTVPSQLSRLRPCGFLTTGRPLLFTFSRENTSTLYAVRPRVTTATTQSGAVTNPTYTSYSARSIISTRESSTGESDRSRIPLIRPYRILLDDISHIRASVHALIRPSGEENGNQTVQEQRLNAISPLDRRDRLRSHLLDVEEVEIDRDLQRPFTYVSPFRRLSSDSESTSTTPTNTQRPSPQQWVSHNTNHLPLHPRPVPRFHVRPTFDLNNTSPVSRSREDTDSESSTNTTPTMETASSDPATSHSMSPVQLNAGPVPRLQIRPRYLQDQQSQLQLINSPDDQSSRSESNENENERRQFVLSRHSNSPFQPRVPHRIDNSTVGNSFPTTSSSPGSSRPEIPSCMSSFVASGTSSTTRSTPSVFFPVGNVASSMSKATNTATTTVAGDDSFVRGTRELRNRLHFFDHVKLLLRDRIRNSSEHASTDSTVNYSNIANESEGETRNMLEEGNSSNGLGPRGLDPMLSSVSENADGANDQTLFPSSSIGSSNGESDMSPSNLEFAVPWESDSDTIPFPTSPRIDPLESDTDTMQLQSSPGRQEETTEREPTREESNDPSEGNATNSELSMRQKIELLSLQIENIERRCRARIEIVQLRHIRKMWENLTAQIRSLHSAVQNNRNPVQQIEDCNILNPTRDPYNPSLNNLKRLAISDTPPQREESPNENFYNHFREVVESMVNALIESQNGNVSTGSQMKPETSQNRRNETDDPQPGPSGLSGNGLPQRDNLTFRIYRALRDVLNKTRRRRDLGTGIHPPRHYRFRFGESQRSRFRRHGRHSLDSSLPRVSPRSFSSSYESPNQHTESRRVESERNPGPSSLNEASSGSSGACQSCGHKKKSKDLPKQKRRSTETGPEGDAGASTSKIMKNSVGERTSASTSNDTGGNTSRDINSTGEILRKMIQRMEGLVRSQRETFRRSAELTTNRRSRRSGPPHDENSSDDSDSDNTSGRHRSVYMRNFPRSNRAQRKDIVILRRALIQLRVRRLIDFMFKSLGKYFEEHPSNSSGTLDDQIINLYTLLHLALELTDLLLDQLNATSLDLERAWGAENQSPSADNQRRETESFFSDRARAIRRSRERSRGLTRSSLHSSFSGPTREESRRYFQNPFLRTFSRPGTSRACLNQHPTRAGSTGSGSVFCRYRPSTTLFPGYRRSRRMAPRMSSVWSNAEESPRRSSSLPVSRESQSSVILPSRIGNGNNSNNQFRDFRFWERRNSVGNEGEPHRNSRSDSNNNVNSNNNVIPNNTTNDDNNNNNRNNNNNANNNNDSANNNMNNFVTNTSNNNVSSSNNNTVISGNAPSSNSLPFSTYLNLREQRPMLWIRYGNNDTSATVGNETQSRDGNFTVPVVHVNDIPVQDISMLNQPRHRPQSPTPRVPEDLWRWRAWRPRFLHPRYIGPHPFDDLDSNDLPEWTPYYRIMNATSGGPNQGVYTLDPVIITDAPMSPHHRIQAWDFSKMNIPDISDREANGVVAECKIHNDASVDVSNDGHLLVTLLPSGRFSVTTMLGVYSLDWSSLGQLLYKTSFEQNAVSVSLSPTNRHLLVGLASRPLVVRDRTNMAQIFRLEGARPSPPGGTWQSGRGRLVHMRDLEQTRETNITSLNCIRWAPGAGQGLVYGTNTGQLKVLR